MSKKAVTKSVSVVVISHISESGLVSPSNSLAQNMVIIIPGYFS